MRIYNWGGQHAHADAQSQFFLFRKSAVGAVEAGRTSCCLVACDLQMRQTKAVATHDGLRKRTARARIETHLARMLSFDFELGVKEWRRASAALSHALASPEPRESFHLPYRVVLS